MIKQYQLKDGSVRYSYIAYVGIDPLTGKEKRVRKRGFKTKKEAKIAESQFLLKVGQDGFFDKPDRIMAIILAITHENILRLVVRKSPTGESTHYFFFMIK